MQRLHVSYAVILVDYSSNELIQPAHLPLLCHKCVHDMSQSSAIGVAHRDGLRTLIGRTTADSDKDFTMLGTLRTKFWSFHHDTLPS